MNGFRFTMALSEGIVFRLFQELEQFAPSLRLRVQQETSQELRFETAHFCRYEMLSKKLPALPTAGAIRIASLQSILNSRAQKLAATGRSGSGIRGIQEAFYTLL